MYTYVYINERPGGGGGSKRDFAGVLTASTGPCTHTVQETGRGPSPCARQEGEASSQSRLERQMLYSYTYIVHSMKVLFSIHAYIQVLFLFFLLLDSNVLSIGERRRRFRFESFVQYATQVQILRVLTPTHTSCDPKRNEQRNFLPVTRRFPGPCK
jgi:hypothetical protein